MHRLLSGKPPQGTSRRIMTGMSSVATHPVRSQGNFVLRLHKNGAAGVAKRDSSFSVGDAKCNFVGGKGASVCGCFFKGDP